MRMFQVTTVYWGLLPVGDVGLGKVTLLGGESGSGKSSIIDAMIAVMTGNEARFARYNSAQTETQSHKKTKRSLGSYVLGFDDSGPPHRQFGAHGYAAISWIPDETDEGPSQPFTAIIGAEVRPDHIGDQVIARVHEEVRLLAEAGFGDFRVDTGLRRLRRAQLFGHSWTGWLRAQLRHRFAISCSKK